MLDVLFVLLAQAAAGAPAQAPEPAPATQEATAESTAPAVTENANNRRRCRVENVTGSRLGSRVCMTRDEEEELEREGRFMLERSMRMFDNQSGGGGN